MDADQPKQDVYRVKGRSLVIGDTVYKKGDTLPASKLGKQLPMMVSQRLIEKVDTTDHTPPASRGLFADIFRRGNKRSR